MSYFETKQIYPWLYSIYDPLGAFCYLVVGEDKALLYDAVYGVGDLPAEIKSITDKPLTVVLGHGHVDHTCGAYQFDEVYLHENDFELCRRHTSSQFRDDILKNIAEGKVSADIDQKAYRTAGTGNIKKLDIGTLFDLGGLTLEVIGMPGHTQGSVGLLAREKRVMLVSDAANPHIWMFLEESSPIKQYIDMLGKVSLLDFDTFYFGHGNDPLPKTDFQRYIKVASEASIDKATPYNVIDDLHPYIYQEDGVAIVFNVDKL